MKELSLCLAQIRWFDTKRGFGFADIIESSPPIDPPHQTIFFHATGHRLAVGADWQSVCFSGLTKDPKNLLFDPPLDLTPGAEIIAVAGPDDRGFKAIQWGQLAAVPALRATFAQGWGPQDSPAEVKIVMLRASSTRKRSTPPLVSGELDSLDVTDEGDFHLSLTRFWQVSTPLSLNFRLWPDQRARFICPAANIRPVPRSANATTWRIMVKPPSAPPLTQDIACIIIKPLVERAAPEA